MWLSKIFVLFIEYDLSKQEFWLNLQASSGWKMNVLVSSMQWNLLQNTPCHSLCDFNLAVTAMCILLNVPSKLSLNLNLLLQRVYACVHKQYTGLHAQRLWNHIDITASLKS